MILKNMQPFVGQHCETTATGTLLNHLGIELSEPMLFGLGEGLGFVYWNSKAMAFPFLGGRVKPDVLTANLCAALGLELDVNETASKKKAWQRVVDALESGRPIGLKLDCYHLEYFTKKIHFAGHYVAMVGYDNTAAYVVDTAPQGTRMQTSLESLAAARSEKGPMASKNLSYTIAGEAGAVDLKRTIRKAIARNAHEFLNPPITNLGYKGIAKAGKQLVKEFDRDDDARAALQTTAMLMERGGTGGAMFRNFYRDFLRESAALLGDDRLGEAGERFADIAPWWTTVSAWVIEASATGDRAKMLEASEILADLSERERAAMALLDEASV